MKNLGIIATTPISNKFEGTHKNILFKTESKISNNHTILNKLNFYNTAVALDCDGNREITKQYEKINSNFEKYVK